MSFIFRYLRIYRRHFLLGLGALLATNGLTLAIPWMLKEAVEALGRSAPLRTITWYALAICAIALLLVVVRTLSRLWILGASRRVAADVRESLYAHLLSLPASFFARHRTGDLMSRAVNDMRLVRSLFGPGVLQIINVAVLYTAGLAVMIIIDPVLTMAAIIPYPLLLIGVARVSRVIHQRSNRAQEQLAEISNRVQENLSGINLVKAYVREDSEIASFETLSAEYRVRSLALARSRGLIVTMMYGLGGLSTIAVLWLGGLHVIDGTMTLGGFFAFISYLALLTSPTIMMGWMIGVFQRGLGAIHRLEEILAERSDLPGDRVRGDGPTIHGAIQARRLHFTYPDGSRPALQGVTFDAPRGAIIGVVGRVGAGKSTLVRLLAAIHPVAPGTLLIDGHDIGDIPTSHLRRHVGVVPQESFLFSRSIADNIALGRPGAARERIEQVARLAGMGPDLDQFPRGLDTIVGERGITLSGGQRQRVALARAMLLDPPVLILDDALSSVDAETEQAILESLARFMRGRTTIIVSHRMSTVLQADRILVLEDGAVAEFGDPGTLLDRKGPFAAMYRRQQIESELEAL